MKEIHAAIPDHEALTALEPQELAGKLLFLMRERFAREKNQLRPGDFITEVMTANPRSECGEG